MASPRASARSTTATAANTIDIASPHHGRYLVRRAAAMIMAAGGMKGTIARVAPRVLERCDSHQVGSPSCQLALHTAANPAATAAQPMMNIIDHPSESSPLRISWSLGRSDTIWPRSVACRLPSDTVSAMSIPNGRVPDGPSASASPQFAKLSIFYPMWNEEDYAARALEFGRRACEDLIAAGEIGDYELIVVDDASTDRTPEIVDALARDDAHIRVVRHGVNRKLGGAMKTGFAAATGDLILYTDADLPFDISELSRALRLMREYDADIVSAYRFDRTGEGSLRAIYTVVYNALIKLLFGVRVRDINFAFKLCRSSVFDHLELRSEGSFIDAELVIRASRMGLSILQFGVDYFPRTRGESTLSRPSVIVNIVREMWALRRDLSSITPLEGTARVD